MSAAPPLPELRRTAVVDFLFLDLSRCERCQSSGANIDTALATIDGILDATGARVELHRIQVADIEQARELRFVSSPTIRVNGRDIAPELRESECGANGCGCGPGVSCRSWRYGGREYPEAPVGLIVDAILSALYAGEGHALSAAPAYELPDNLRRVFAAKEAGASEGGCCG